MIQTIAYVLVGLVAALHIYFMHLEMFVWATPRGAKIFSQTLEQARSSKTLAFNQGLYNGFLAAGLAWSLLHPNTGMAHQLMFFFLGCVIVAGIVGGITVNKRIALIQAGPAALATALLAAV